MLGFSAVASQVAQDRDHSWPSRSPCPHVAQYVGVPVRVRAGRRRWLPGPAMAAKLPLEQGEDRPLKAAKLPLEQGEDRPARVSPACAAPHLGGVGPTPLGAGESHLGPVVARPYPTYGVGTLCELRVRATQIHDFTTTQIHAAFTTAQFHRSRRSCCRGPPAGRGGAAGRGPAAGRGRSGRSSGRFNVVSFRSRSQPSETTRGCCWPRTGSGQYRCSGHRWQGSLLSPHAVGWRRTRSASRQVLALLVIVALGPRNHPLPGVRRRRRRVRAAPGVGAGPRFRTTRMTRRSAGSSSRSCGPCSAPSSAVTLGIGSPDHDVGAALGLLYALARRLGVRRGFAAAAVVLFALSPLAVSVVRQVYLDNFATPWILARRSCCGFATLVPVGLRRRRDLLRRRDPEETSLLALPGSCWRFREPTRARVPSA